MSETNGIVIDYKDLTHSNYPRQEDKLMDFHDPSDEEAKWIKEYNSYMASGRVADATDVLVRHPSLRKCIINADILLSLHHSIIAVQRYVYDNVLDKIVRLGNQKGDWNEQMSSDATDESLRLNKYDIVRYPVDDINQYFMVIGNNIKTGDIPIESDGYIQLTIKGDKGDIGVGIESIDAEYGNIGERYFTEITFMLTNKDSYKYTIYDGIDGADGIGMNPKGAWTNNRDYFQYDLVSHNGYLWYCLEDVLVQNPVQEPTDDSTVWVKFNISMQSAVGTDIPSNLGDGGIWMHLQDDGHVVLKTKNHNGEYLPLYPETYASYVKDVNGNNIQKWIYQRYFERDDVDIHLEDNDHIFITTAKLKNTNIVVAKSVLTDVNEDGTNFSEEFTCYDDTGIYVMYRYKKNYIDNNNNTYDVYSELLFD